MDPKQNEVEGNGLENASSEEIRDSIRGTRRGMDDTLNELGERLHPRHLLDDVLDLFRGNSGSSNKLAQTSKDVGRTISRELREHPLPALLVGAGIAWWIFDATSDDEDESQYGRRDYRTMRPRPPEPRSLLEGDAWQYREYEGRSGVIENGGPSVGEKTGENTDGDKGTLEKAGDRVKEAASAVGDKVSEAASAVGDKLKSGGNAVTSTAGAGLRSSSRAMHDYSARGRHAAGHQAEVVTQRFREASDEYPLALGGAFLAAGLLAGLLLPRSEQEDKWMGEASDDLKENARAVGEEALEKGKAVATQTAVSAMDEAEARGITPENVVDKASRAVSETVKASTGQRDS